jgi:glycosyltransferase involved in cell wall biosynthesis
MLSILVLTPQVPYPPQQGTALRNWGILHALADRYDVSLISFHAPDQNAEVPRVLQDHLHHIAVFPQPPRRTMDRFRDLFTVKRPDLVLRLQHAEFARTLKEWLTHYHFDWIIVEGLEMAPYLDILETCQSRPRILFDDHNCEYILQQRAARTDWRKPKRWIGALYSSIQWRKLRRYESQVSQAADLVVSVSEEDAEWLNRIAPDVQPLVIPNGISYNDYAQYHEEVNLHQPAFVFTGTMNFRPNIDGVLWFAQKVWSRILTALPHAHFYIVGRHPHERLNILQDVPGIVITGGVPETRQYICAAAVYVVPLLVGGGTRLKILESTAMSKAVVATTLGAEGFENPDQAMVLADTPADFAAACIRLAKDAEERKKWGARASTFAKAYDWDVLLPPLLAHLEASSA